MFGFLAKECGWDKDFISERFTLKQIERYYEVLNKKNREELREQAVIMSMSMAYATGHLKQGAWNKFLNSINPRKKNLDVNKTLRQMKTQGLNVEER